jgi:uncharacterized protein YndB with AHSA1/START domain
MLIKLVLSQRVACSCGNAPGRDECRRLTTKGEKVNDLIAQATTTIDAPVAKVWDALTNPEVIKQYMFGTHVVSEWKEGSPIVWQGEWQGRKYEDKGVILKLVPERMLRYSHFSPLTGQPDTPENYHTVTVELSGRGEQTHVALTQDHNASEEERDHSAENWAMMLEGLKTLLERHMVHGD